MGIRRLLPTRRIMTMGAGSIGTTLTKGLWESWNLDEASGVRIGSQSGLSLTDNNTVAQATGLIGNCASFTAGNLEFLSIASSALNGNSDWSINLWFQLKSGSGTQTLISKYNQTGNQRSWAIEIGNSEKVGIRASSNGSSDGFTSSVTTTIAESTWYMLTVTFQSSSGVTNVYLNGSDTVEVTRTTALFDSAADFCIGARESGAFGHTGYIDEVSVWPTRILTAAEKTELYNGGSGLTYPFT